MTTLILRLYKPEKLLTAQYAPMHLELKCTGYFLEDFAFQDGENHERPGKAAVKFSQVTNTDDAELTYVSRWTDPEDKITYPGSLALSLPLDEKIESFITSNDFDARYLILQLGIEDRHRAILCMGRGEDRDCVWDTAKASSLPVKIECIAVDCAPRPEAKPAAEIPIPIPTPLAWQAEALSSFERLQLQQVQAIRDLHRQLGFIRIILLIMLVCSLIYGIAK